MTAWLSPSTSPSSPSPARCASPAGDAPHAGALHPPRRLLEAQPEEPPRLHDRVPPRGRSAPPRSRPPARWSPSEHGRRRRCHPGESSRSRLPTSASTRPMRSRRSPPPDVVLDLLVARPARASQLPWRGLRAAWEQVHGQGSRDQVSPLLRSRPRCSLTSSG